MDFFGFGRFYKCANQYSLLKYERQTNTSTLRRNDFLTLTNSGAQVLDWQIKATLNVFVVCVVKVYSLYIYIPCDYDLLKTLLKQVMSGGLCDSRLKKLVFQSVLGCEKLLKS